MPEDDDFGIKLKASKKLKKIEMFFLTLCLLFINQRKLSDVKKNGVSRTEDSKNKMNTKIISKI